MCSAIIRHPEAIRMFVSTIIYPLVGLYVALRLAKFHFEKDIKKQYLLAKDKVATDIINKISVMLVAMWEIVNIDTWIAKGDKNPDLPQRRQQALMVYQKAMMDSYLSLGMMGLYFGAKIVEEVSQFQSDLSEMIMNNNFEVFKEKGGWDNYRRKRILPILNKVYRELRYTVFDRTLLDWFMK